MRSKTITKAAGVLFAALLSVPAWAANGPPAERYRNAGYGKLC